MSLVAGSVSVSGGVASGAGFAKLVYDQLEANTDFQGVVGPGLQSAKSQLANIANAVATLITYVKANALVTTTDAGSAPIAWTGSSTAGTIT